MDWKKGFNFTASIILLASAITILLLFFAASSGMLDLTSEPVTDAETNTTGIPSANASEYPGIDGKTLEMAIFRKVNELRRTRGIEPFVHSERVRLIARIHSADMAEQRYFNHTNPDGVAPPGRHERFEGCEEPNENIARWKHPPTNSSTVIAEKIVSDWENSSGHNTTMTSDYYHVAGVGVYVTENKSLYVTQNFCREHPNA